MVGRDDQRWLPGDLIRFGSLEFIVGAQTDVSGILTRLFLVSDLGSSARRAGRTGRDLRAEDEVKEVAPRTAAPASFQPGVRFPSSWKGPERVARCPNDPLPPRLVLRGEREIRRSFVYVGSPGSGDDDPSSGPLGLGERCQHDFGLSNIAKVYGSTLQEVVGLGLGGLKGGPWPPEYEENPTQAADSGSLTYICEGEVRSDCNARDAGHEIGH